MDVNRGFFHEQSWCNLMLGMFPNMHMWYTLTHNVGFWNLRSYNMRKTDNIWVTDGGPLRVFHFSAFEPRNPGIQSTCRCERPDGIQATGDLLQFYRDYANRLMLATRGLRLTWPRGGTPLKH
jgi:hypothetical protein